MRPRALGPKQLFIDCFDSVDIFFSISTGKSMHSYSDLLRALKDAIFDSCRSSADGTLISASFNTPGLEGQIVGMLIIPEERELLTHPIQNSRSLYYLVREITMWHVDIHYNNKNKHRKFHCKIIFLKREGERKYICL